MLWEDKEITTQETCRCFFVSFVYYFWRCWLFVFVRGLSLVASSGGSSLVVEHGLLTAGASLVAEPGFWGAGVGGCGEGLSCPLPCGVILDGDQTHVPCISVWILNHWTGGVLLLLSFPTLGGISWLSLHWNNKRCLYSLSSSLRGLFSPLKKKLREGH